MQKKKTIHFDNGVILRQTAEGTVTISRGGRRMSWGIIGFAVFAFGCLGWVLIETTKIEEIFSVLIFVVFAVVMLGRMMLPMIRSLGMPTVTIDPIGQVVKTGEQTIPFGKIADIGAEADNAPVMDDVVTIIFLLYINPETKIELGRKTIIEGNTEELEKFKTELVSLLKDAMKKN